MIVELISRSLILAFGYAYPAFQCFKTLEKNKVGIQELRFWCQYWTIVSILTILEKFLDIFISWLPLYRGIKLAFFVYLWHPGTKGSSYVYETLLQPYMAKHETEIDRRIAELKERIWNVLLSYWYTWADSSSKKVFYFLQFMISQCMSLTLARPQVPAPAPAPAQAQARAQAADQDAEIQQTNEAPTPTPPSTPSGIFKRNISEKRRPPVAPPGTSPLHRSLTARSSSFNKIKLHSQTQFIHNEDIQSSDSDKSSVLEEKSSDSDHDLLAARFKLRPVKSSKMMGEKGN